MSTITAIWTAGGATLVVSNAGLYFMPISNLPNGWFLGTIATANQDGTFTLADQQTILMDSAIWTVAV
jgi:hypothetical protein